MEEKEEIKKEDMVSEEKTDTVDRINFFSTNWKLNIVSDENAPKLYSRRVIYIFSILFSVFTGGILLSINLKKVKREDVIWMALGYSLVYTVISGVILNQIKTNVVLALLVNMLGSFVLYNIFWKKYIGAETKYQTKSIWIPLLICVVVFSLVLWAIIVNSAF